VAAALRQDAHEIILSTLHATVASAAPVQDVNMIGMASAPYTLVVPAPSQVGELTAGATAA